MASGSSMREIAGGLHRAASTVSREIARHGGRPAYRAYDADQQAWNAALRPKRCLLAVNSELRDMVASKLMLDWSPEQIAGWLKAQYPHNESMHVSHETIYRSLFLQARGLLKKELMDHLRSKRRMRRSPTLTPIFFLHICLPDWCSNAKGDLLMPLRAWKRRGDHRAEVFSFEPCSAGRSPSQDDRMMHAQCYVNSNNTQQKITCTSRRHSRCTWRIRGCVRPF